MATSSRAERAPASARGLGRRAFAAIGFSFIASTAAKLLTMVSTFVLARLLTPSDFGIANLGTLALMFLLPLTDIGIAQAIIRTQATEIRRRALTAFWLVVLLGTGLYLAVFIGSVPVANFYGQPEIAPMLRLISLAIILYSISRVPSAMLERDLRYGRKAIPEVTASFAYGVVAIILALLHFGFWSIVGATLARSALLTIGVLVIGRWRPGLSFDLSVAHELITYARLLMATSVLRLIYTNVDNAIVGRALGMSALGYYAMAYNLGNLPAIQVAGPLGAVLFPAYARMLPDLKRVRRATLRLLRVVALLMLPVTVIGVIISPSLVPLLVGAKWIPMTAALQWLLLYGCFHALGPIYWTLMLAADLNHVSLRINLASLALALAAAIPIVAHFGITGIAAEFTGLELLRLLLMALAVRGRFELRLGDQLRALWPALRGSLLAAASLVALAALRAPTTLTVAALELMAATGIYLLYLLATGELSRSQIEALKALVGRGR